MGEVIRFHLRLGQKDGDLILLGSKYRITKMVRHAIQFYLGKADERIPLPPYNEKVPKDVVYSILLYPETDSEEIAFLQSVPNGYRSAVMKRLLRYAMEQCDLRLIMENAPKPIFYKNARRSVPHQKAPEPRIAKRPIPPDPPVSQTADDDEDDIFSGI